VNGYKSTLCLRIHAQRRRTKRKTCEQVFGAATTQDQADQIGKDLADGAAPLSRVCERLMNGDLRLLLIYLGPNDRQSRG
jgi:hypothetical protein